MAEEAEGDITDVVDDAAPQEGATAQDPPEGDSPQTPSEIDVLAQEMGWAPKDQWRGDPNDWKDAKTFLKTTVDINRTISREVRELKDTTSRMAKTSAAIAEREIRREREEIEARFKSAVAEQDTDAAWEASEQLRKLPNAEDPSIDPAVADFKARNGWFEADPAATAVAQAVAARLHAQGKTPAEQTKAAEDEVRRRFPELFDAPARTQAKDPPSVNAPGSRTARPTPKAKGFAELPRDAQAAAHDFLKRGRITSLADYAKDYWNEEEG